MLKKITNERTSSQPINFRTGGSTFKNTLMNPAWKLIDKINFRGKDYRESKSVRICIQIF